MAEHNKFQIFGFHITPVSQEILFLVTFVTFMCIVRVFYAGSKAKLYIPESILLVMIGIILGLFVQFVPGLSSAKTLLEISPEIFLFVFVPIIIFDATYFLNKTSFFRNIVEIVVYAVLGTVFNAALISAFLFIIKPFAITNFSTSDILAYSSLLSAIDPVSVIAIMEQLHVNQDLYYLAFGEATLNDGVAIVLYSLTKSIGQLSEDGYSVGKIVGLGLSKFFISVCGAILTAVGVSFCCSFLTKFTHKKPLLEPLFLLISCLFSYVLADALLFSGVIAVMTAALLMSRYTDSNVNKNQLFAFKNLIHALGQTFENLVFLDMGSQLIFVGFSSQKIDYIIVFLLPLVAFIARSLGVLFFTFTLNQGNKKIGKKITLQDQMILTWCGLRGAIAFALSKVMAAENADEQISNTILFSTSIMIIVTIFVYGLSMRGLILKLKIKQESSQTIGSKILNGPIISVKNSIRAILGRNMKGKLFFKRFDRLLQKILLKNYLPDEIEIEELIADIKQEQINKYAGGEELIQDMEVRENNFNSFMGLKKSLWKKHNEHQNLIQ